MNRRFRLIGLAMLLITWDIADATEHGSGAAPSVPPTKMNLLVVQTDEHNFRTLGCYRETLPPAQALVWGKEAFVETPAIDSIAKRGAICTSFYATSPVCTPSRAAFFTGRYPHQTGSYQNDQPLRGDMVTFAATLQRNGYATGYAGKWHLDGPGKPQWAPERQFGFADNRFMFNRGHWKRFDITDGQPVVGTSDGKGRPSYGLGQTDEKHFATDWLTDRALDFIDEHAVEPFCYHLSLPDPHGPNTVRPPYDTMYRDMPIRAPMTFSQRRDNPKWAPGLGRNAASKFNAPLMATYFGMVKCIDDNVARLLAKLDELNLAERTMIVFTSDHGDLCFEHGRVNKGNPYEASAKIPMIIAAPGVIPPGTRIDAAMSTVDFAPTVLALMQAHVDSSTANGFQGFDASEWLAAGSVPKSETDSHVTFVRSSGLNPSWVAAVTDRFKLVVSVSEVPWLFDARSDPDELHNSIDVAANRAAVASLASEMLAYGESTQDPQLLGGPLAMQLQQLVSAGKEFMRKDATRERAR